MRHLLAAALLAASTTAVAAEPPSLRDLTWLAGDWSMTTGTRVVEEHWTTPSSNSLIGMSRTVQDGRTTAFEFVRIELREADVFYVAQPNGRPPTDFKLATSRPGELIFEGDGHDRVKRITYRREGRDGLVAVVEGESNGRPFTSEYRYRQPPPVLRPLTQ